MSHEALREAQRQAAKRQATLPDRSYMAETLAKHYSPEHKRDLLALCDRFANGDMTLAEFECEGEDLRNHYRSA